MFRSKKKEGSEAETPAKKGFNIKSLLMPLMAAITSGNANGLLGIIKSVATDENVEQGKAMLLQFIRDQQTKYGKRLVLIIEPYYDNSDVWFALYERTTDGSVAEAWKKINLNAITAEDIKQLLDKPEAPAQNSAE